MKRCELGWVQFPQDGSSSLVQDDLTKGVTIWRVRLSSARPKRESGLQSFLKLVVEEPACSSEGTWELPSPYDVCRTVVFGRRPDSGLTAE